MYSNHDSNSHRIMLIGYKLVGKIKSYLDIWGPHGKISSCEEECRQIFSCDKPVGTLLCNLNLPRKRDGKNTIYLFISTSKKQMFHRSAMTQKLPKYLRLKVSEKTREMWPMVGCTRSLLSLTLKKGYFHQLSLNRSFNINNYPSKQTISNQDNLIDPKELKKM